MIVVQYVLALYNHSTVIVDLYELALYNHSTVIVVIYGFIQSQHCDSGPMQAYTISV